jgi:hypothetical protein
VYYYTGLANFWAQRSLPDPAEFDEENEFHRLTRRIVDSSYPDFQRMARILEAIDQDRLNRTDRPHIIPPKVARFDQQLRRIVPRTHLALGISCSGNGFGRLHVSHR